MDAIPSHSAPSFACGQLVSLFSMASLVMAKLLVMRDVNAPSFINCCFYIALAVVCITVSWLQQPKPPAQLDKVVDPETLVGSPVLTPVDQSPTATNCDLESASTEQTSQQQTKTKEPRWWLYLLVALFDLQANNLAVRSLAYTDYATAGLMLNLTIPFVSLLSWFAYNRTYSRRHIVGCGPTMLGGVVLFVGSYARDAPNGTNKSSAQLYGCVLALLAAFLYGASNITSQRYLCAQSASHAVKSLGIVGAFGSGLAVIQMLLLERVEVTSIVWTTDVSVCVVAYVAAMFTFYILVSLLPQQLMSPVYSLSVLGSNMYLPFASAFVVAEMPRNYFYVALLLVLIGLTKHYVEHSHTARQQQTTEQQHQKSQQPSEPLQLQPDLDPTRAAALLNPLAGTDSVRMSADVNLIAIQIEHAAL